VARVLLSGEPIPLKIRCPRNRSTSGAPRRCRSPPHKPDLGPLSSTTTPRSEIYDTTAPWATRNPSASARSSRIRGGRRGGTFIRCIVLKTVDSGLPCAGGDHFHVDVADGKDLCTAPLLEATECGRDLVPAASSGHLPAAETDPPAGYDGTAFRIGRLHLPMGGP